MRKVYIRLIPHGFKGTKVLNKGSFLLVEYLQYLSSTGTHEHNYSGSHTCPSQTFIDLVRIQK